MKNVTFQVLEGIDKGRIFRDLPVPVTIGREDGNLLRLNDERVSRFHAKVQQEDGDVILTDLESTNGTRVNGAPVQIRRLRPGDQITIGRSMLLFGTLEEIASRRMNEPTAQNSNVPQGQTISGTVPGDDLGFHLNTFPNNHEGADPVWGLRERQLPPLPQKLSAAQSARLAEIFDYLHHGLSVAVENIDANEEGTSVRLGFNEWQTIQTLQLFLARYIRSISEPGNELE